MSKLIQSIGQSRPIDLVPQGSYLTAVSFDQSGDFIATGQRNGMINVYERRPQDTGETNADQSFDGNSSPQQETAFSYEAYTSFKSHEPEFDYLKSLEIEERINRIVWCPPTGSSRLLLSTNDKTIKLWRLNQSRNKQYASSHSHSEKTRTSSSSSSSSSSKTNGRTSSSHEDDSEEDDDTSSKEVENELVLTLPQPSSIREEVRTKTKKVYANAHAYHVNSISMNSDGETFLSADDLRILWWNLEVNDRAYNIVDTKPEHMEDLTEVIMTAKFHPSHCHTFAWTSSRGRIFVADTRERALCDQTSIVLGDQNNGTSSSSNSAVSSLFTEIISSASDIQFLPSDPHILSRDYMTLKLWDMRFEKGPILTFAVHDQIKDLLPDLYDSDNIFDKFQVALSSDGRKIATGSYNSNTMVFDRDAYLGGEGEGRGSEENSTLDRRPFSPPSSSSSSSLQGVQVLNPTIAHQTLPLSRPLFSPSFLKKGVMQIDFHPTEQVLAAPVMNRLHFFSLDE
jgi:serine/threonine-protein phosphatase 2A regulatory subunit B